MHTHFPIAEFNYNLLPEGLAFIVIVMVYVLRSPGIHPYLGTVSELNMGRSRGCDRQDEATFPQKGLCVIPCKWHVNSGCSECWSPSVRSAH